MIVKTAFTVLLMVSLLGIAACSDNGADEGGTTASPDVETTSPTAAESNEPILIKTHLLPPTRRASRPARFFPGPPSATQPSAPGGHSSMGLC